MLAKMKYYARMWGPSRAKHWVYRGFFVGARYRRMYAYLGWYNSSNGPQFPKHYKPSSYSFTYAWYFPFTYLEYVELQRRIDWSYNHIQPRLALMRTVLANLKHMFEKFGREIDKIKTKIIEYRNVVIEKRKTDLEKNILQNDLNIQNFTNKINENELKIEKMRNKLNTIN
jgi:hypothetical protein